MAFNGAEEAYFAIDDTGGTARQIVGLTSVDGLPGELEHADSTAIGDSIRKSHPLLYNVQFTLEGWYDTTSSTGSGIVLGADFAAQQANPTLTFTFDYGPAGNASTAARRTGEAKIESYVEGARLGELVNFRAGFRAQTLTIGSYT